MTAVNDIANNGGRTLTGQVTQAFERLPLLAQRLSGTNPCRVIVRADLERVENVLLSCDAKQPISLAFPNHTIA